MKIEIDFQDMKWDFDREYADCIDMDEQIEKFIKEKTLEGIQDRLLKNVEERLSKKINESEQKAFDKVQKQIDSTIDNYINLVTAESISELVIPYKTGSWSSKAVQMPITEYIGMKYKSYVEEKRFTKEGEIPRYSGDGKCSLTEVLINKVFGKALDEKVAKTISQARAKAEKEIVGSLEKSLQENLTKDMIKKMDLPQVLKKLQEQHGTQELPEK